MVRAYMVCRVLLGVFHELQQRRYFFSGRFMNHPRVQCDLTYGKQPRSSRLFFIENIRSFAVSSMQRYFDADPMPRKRSDRHRNSSRCCTTPQYAHGVRRRLYRISLMMSPDMQMEEKYR